MIARGAGVQRLRGTNQSRAVAQLLHACRTQAGLYAYIMPMIDVSDNNGVLSQSDDSDAWCVMKVGRVNQGGMATLQSRVVRETNELARCHASSHGPRVSLGVGVGVGSRRSSLRSAPPPPPVHRSLESDLVFLSVGCGMATQEAEVGARRCFLPLGEALSVTEWTSFLYASESAGENPPVRSVVGLTELVLVPRKVAALMQRAFHRHGVKYDPRRDVTSLEMMPTITEPFSVTLTIKGNGEPRVVTIRFVANGSHCVAVSE